MSAIVRDVGGDVLAGLAVAARQRLHQPPFLVAQRAGQAVDLGLGGERDRLVVGQVEEAADAGDELDHLLVGEGVVEAQHRPRVGDLGEMAGGRGADQRGSANRRGRDAGKAASSAAFSRISASYSASLISGASSP